jgi:ATP-dependent Clp protease ATP-binding subunit ClpB
LNRILEIELNSVQERVLAVNDVPHFVCAVTEPGKQFLLYEGTNMEYGARQLKRAIDRFVVRPLSRLIASRQIFDGDVIEIDYTPQSAMLTFTRQDGRVGVPGPSASVNSAAMSQVAYATAS